MVKLVARTDLDHEFIWTEGALYWVTSEGVGVKGSPVKLYYGADTDPEDIYTMPGIITDVVTEGV